MSYDLQVWTTHAPQLPIGLPDAWRWQEESGVWIQSQSNWQVVVGPVHRIEPEDVPESVNAVIPGIAHMVELNLEPAVAPQAARALLKRVAKALAFAGHGVVVDPQTDTLTTPTGVRRYVAPPRSATVTALELSWFSVDARFASRDGLDRVVACFERSVHEALPVRYGEYEPPSFRYSETGRKHLVDFLAKECLKPRSLGFVVWCPKRPVLNVGLSIGVGKSPAGWRCHRLTLTLEASVLEQAGWPNALEELWRRLAQTVHAFYADVRILRRYRVGAATVAEFMDCRARCVIWRIMTMKTSLGGPQFAATTDVDALVRRGIDTLESTPGVAIAAASYGLPLEDGGGLPFEIVGRPLPPGSPFHGGAGWRAVSAGYFKTLRIPVLRGREFTSADRGASRPVVVINDVLARQQWPDEDPIGQHLVLGHGIGPQFQDEPVREIVGVVGSARENRLDASPGTQVYEPIAQLPDVSNAFVASGTSLAWMVRTTTAPEPLAPTLRQALERTSGLPISSVAPMDDIVGRSIFRQRFAMWLMASFGLSALVLASLGLYGLIGYAVEQRIPEIGIRLALGADASSIARTVLWQGLRLTIAGAVVGLFVALVLTRAMSRLLFDVSPSDPPTFVAVSLAVGLVAMLAAWLPARRASRIDPIVALRSQ